MYSSIDFADGQGSGIFANLNGIYAEGVARNCSNNSGAVYGAYNYALATTTQYDIDNIWASKHNCLLESGGAVDADVYAIEALVDCDNAAIAGNLYGIRNTIDIEAAAAITGTVYGVHTSMDDDDNTASQSIIYQADAQTNIDWAWKHWDGVNSTLRSQIGALNGQIDAEGSINASQSLDYAEYFESKDGKVIANGTTVKLDNGKIVACSDGDVPLGVIRPKSAQCIVGGAHVFHWAEKYMKDDYGGDVMENYSITKWTVEISYDDYKAGIEDESGGSIGGKIEDRNKNKEGDTKSALENQIYIREYKFHSDRIPSGVSVPNDAQVIEVGNKRQKLNPSYDGSKEYKSREERDEWHIVGLLGQIPITKGQPVASNWIKMKDVSDTVEMYFVK